MFSSTTEMQALCCVEDALVRHITHRVRASGSVHETDCLERTPSRQDILFNQQPGDGLCAAVSHSC